MSTKSKKSILQKKLFREWFYTSLRWAVRSFFLSPPSSIFLFIFAAPWLTGQSVAMECAVGQKKRRSRNSLTSWRGLTCFHHLSTLPVFVSYSLSSFFPPSLLLYHSFSHSFSVSALIYFDAGSGTPAWPFPPFSLSQAHTQTQSCILSLQQHRLVACTRTAPTHSHKQECVGISLWLPL